MVLEELVAGLPEVLVIRGPAQVEVLAIAYHSQEVERGSLFVAVPGFRTDGHKFVQEAVQHGAVAVAVMPERVQASLPPHVAQVEISSPRTFLARVSQRFFGDPSSSLYLAGITGTNGKTTTCYLLTDIFEAAGRTSGLISTVERRVRDKATVAARTTPEAPDLQELLAIMRDNGATHVAMEVSSHAIALSRALGCHFDAVALTNVTQDHLDFHGSFEDYLQTKLRLFTEYVQDANKPVQGVVNADDPVCSLIRQRAECPTVSCGTAETADYRIVGVAKQTAGTSVQVQAPDGLVELSFPLYGLYNVQNAVMAAAIARSARLEWGEIERGLTGARVPAGRLERVDAGQDFYVFVDYAHTPDSLSRVLGAVREFSRGRVIAVFGCGGDRDQSKRPLMGKAALENSDLCIVTSDNPRSEEPEAIIAHILTGMPEREKVTVEPDRATAIRLAVEQATPGDVVLIAGKGHENYQIFKDRTIHFSDREVALKALEERATCQ